MKVLLFSYNFGWEKHDKECTRTDCLFEEKWPCPERNFVSFFLHGWPYRPSLCLFFPIIIPYFLEISMNLSNVDSSSKKKKNLKFWKVQQIFLLSNSLNVHQRYLNGHLIPFLVILHWKKRILGKNFGNHGRRLGIRIWFL